MAINLDNNTLRQWTNRPPSSSSKLKLLLTLFTLTTLARQAHGQQIGQPAGETALATIVTNDDDLIPALTMLHTARKHGKLSPSTSRLLLTPERTRLNNLQELLQADNITHITYGSDEIPLLYLFKLVQFSTLVYITPHALVINHLSEIFTCSTICAAFVNPCSFSTDVFAITPSTTTYETLRNFAHSPDNGCETDAQRPDWLDKPSCILNAHFGKALMQAPMHSRTNSLMQRSQRMNIAWAFPHHLFYPRMRIELAERFQPLRVITFDQSSGLQPWKWQSYAFAKMSWQWYRQRNDWNMRLWESRLRQVTSSQASSHLFSLWNEVSALPLAYYLVMALALWLLLGVLTAAWTGRVVPWVGLRFMRRAGWSASRDDKTSRRTGIMLMGLAVGTLVLNWAVCFATIPQSTDPYTAVVYIVVAHVCLTSLMRLCFSLPAYMTYMKALSRLRVGIVKTVALSLCEIVGLFLAFWVAHLLQATTLFEHVLYVVLAFAAYLLFCLVNTAYTSSLWHSEA